jgi:transcriptional regulator with XRE-family HTH domain
MRKVDNYIKEKIKNDPDFKVRYDLIKEKVAVVKKIIEYRIRHKLSQGELAREIGVTQQYISKIEEGEFSNLDAIENILEHIGYRLRLEVVPDKLLQK